MNKPTLVLIDVLSILHRSYHALPTLTDSLGNPTNALYGTSLATLSFLEKYKPDTIIACYDLPEPTKRHKIYEEYKGGRKETEDELLYQIENSYELWEAFNIPTAEASGYEADDVIATYARAHSTTHNVIVVTGDSDLFQLIDEKDNIKIHYFKKGIKDVALYDTQTVQEKYEFTPSYITTYKAIAGDTSDNIPGVAGIGKKTTTQLIQEFGTLDNIYTALKNKEQFIQKGFTERQHTLLTSAEKEAYTAYQLVTVYDDAPVSKIVSWSPSPLTLKKYFMEKDFKSLITKIPEHINPLTLDDNLQKETGVALWVLDSRYTNASLEDVYGYTNKSNWKEALAYIVQELKTKKLYTIFSDIEKPLIPIVQKMTETGVAINAPYLATLKKEYKETLQGIEKKIYKHAGREFNINSSKQVGEIIFDELHITGSKKTSKGNRSTREEVLLSLQDAHPIIPLLLQYRENKKLLSTYIEALPKYQDDTGRIHAEFLQSGTATGRFSSRNPNLQNIPNNTKAGILIRNAFISPKDWKLVAFDYSQIELRVAAFLSNEKVLIESFERGEDIHTIVASKMFKTQPDNITPTMRSQAKAINFGVLYGMGVQALSKSLKVPRSEAQLFLDDYRERFASLYAYRESLKKQAREKGYVTTFFGRRRIIPEIQSNIPHIRAYGERIALNTPIQGTQADIIKIAMIRIHKGLSQQNILKHVRMILQVHDELVFEVHNTTPDSVLDYIEKTMEEVMKDKGIIFPVDKKEGTTWGAMS